MFALTTLIAYYTIEPILAIGHLWSVVFATLGPTYWSTYSHLSDHYPIFTSLDLTSLGQHWANAMLSIFAASSKCETIEKVIVSTIIMTLQIVSHLVFMSADLSVS